MVAAVTAVVPCYRCADTVVRAVDSVLAQTLPLQEIVLVDDASGDATAQHLQRLASLDKRIRVITLERNSGPASARNIGWEASTAEFIAFLDADDAWHPRKMELQYSFMLQHAEYQLSGHGHRWHRKDDEPGSAKPLPGYEEISRTALLLSNRFTTSSVMLKRDLPFRFLSGRRHMEDHLLWLTMVCGGVRAARLRAQLSTRFAAPFGEAGLSGELFGMERAELGNYWQLYRSGVIGAGWLAALQGWSLAKFARRCAIAGIRRAL